VEPFYLRSRDFFRLRYSEFCRAVQLAVQLRNYEVTGDMMDVLFQIITQRPEADASGRHASKGMPRRSVVEVCASTLPTIPQRLVRPG